MALDVRAAVLDFLEGRETLEQRLQVRKLVETLGGYPTPSARRMVSASGRDTARTVGILRDYLAVKNTPKGRDLPATPTLSAVMKRTGQTPDKKSIRTAESSASTLEIICRFLVNPPYGKVYTPPVDGGTEHKTPRKDPSTGQNTHHASWEIAKTFAPGQWGSKVKPFITELTDNVPDDSLVNVWFGRKNADGEMQWHGGGYIRWDGVFNDADWQDVESSWIDAEEGYDEESV